MTAIAIILVFVGGFACGVTFVILTDLRVIRKQKAPSVETLVKLYEFHNQDMNNN